MTEEELKMIEGRFRRPGEWNVAYICALGLGVIAEVRRLQGKLAEAKAAQKVCCDDMWDALHSKADLAEKAAAMLEMYEMMMPGIKKSFWSAKMLSAMAEVPAKLKAAIRQAMGYMEQEHD